MLFGNGLKNKPTKHLFFRYLCSEYRYYMRVFLIFFILLLATEVGLSQEIIGDSTAKRVKTAFVSKIETLDKRPVIDGEGNDEVWSKAKYYTDFTLIEPHPGAPCSKNTQFKILFDDNAIYLFALLSDDKSNILKELAQRDNYNNTDFIEFVFDPYASGIIGFGFSVTPRNLQRDIKYIGIEEDESWDGIWDSAVKLTDNGWQAELRIPFSQLRFPKGGNSNWRFNVFRQMKKSRELSAWQGVNPAISGVLNQSGFLEGIKDVKSPLRLSLFPYLSTYYSPASDKPFKISGGLDLKYGLNDAYTLDLTLIPDFGQVSFDNNVYNLGPFEVQYEERRPFFTEGLELFSRAELFYSRRIGATNDYLNITEYPDSLTVVDFPTKNKLINAFKLTGRGSNGLAVGVFNATEGRSYATLRNEITGKEVKQLINPLTNYNIIVLDKNLKNNSYFSIINTNVMRQGSSRDANVLGTEFNLRNKDQTYFVQANGALSYIQRQGIKQTGHKFFVEMGKNSGNWTYSLEHEEISKDFNPTDLGFLNEYNIRKSELNFAYSTYIPRGIRNKSTTSLELEYVRIIRPDRFANFSVELQHFFLERNFNAVSLTLKAEPILTYDYYEARRLDFSRYYVYPTNYALSFLVSSDYRKAFALDMTYTWQKWNEKGRNKHEINADPRIRINDYFSIKGNVGYSGIENDVGYAYTSLKDDGMLKAGDIVFSRRYLKTVDLGLNPVILVNPNLNFSFRVRNYWSRINNNSFHILEKDGHLSEENIVTDEVPENIVVEYINFEARATWRFAGGSDLILAWDSGYTGFSEESAKYWTTFQRFGDKIDNNIFSVRVNYFLDYERLFVKKNIESVH